jgi:hypothetical protein
MRGGRRGVSVTPVPDFLVQSYVADPLQAISAVGRARRFRSAQLLRTIILPGDEIVLALWRGADTDTVCRATRDVGLAPDRISPATDVTTPLGGAESNEESLSQHSIRPPTHVGAQRREGTISQRREEERR